MSYLEFTMLPHIPERKTDTWVVFSKQGTDLGRIKFYGAWRKFVFYPSLDILFDSTCLKEIAEFVETKTTAWQNHVASLKGLTHKRLAFQ